MTGALRSLTAVTFFNLAPLQMSDSSAPLPLASFEDSFGGVVLAFCKKKINKKKFEGLTNCSFRLRKSAPAAFQITSNYNSHIGPAGDKKLSCVTSGVFIRFQPLTSLNVGGGGGPGGGGGGGGIGILSHCWHLCVLKGSW